MKHEEHKLQCAIIRYLRMSGVFCFAIPNGGKRDAREGARLKKEGVLSGVADIEIWINNKTYFVEVKTEKGRQTSSQKLFEQNALAHGHKYVIWRSLSNAEEFVDNFFKKNHREKK